MRTTRTAPLALAAVLTFALTACNPSASADPTPSKSALPTLPPVSASATPTEGSSEAPAVEGTASASAATPEEQAAAEARSAVDKYKAASSRAMQEGASYDLWKEASPFTMSFALGELSQIQSDNVAGGFSQRGDAVFRDVKVVSVDMEGTGNTKMPTIEFTGCNDFSQVSALQHGKEVAAQGSLANSVTQIGVVYDTTTEPHAWKVGYEHPVEGATC